MIPVLSNFVVKWHSISWSKWMVSTNRLKEDLLQFVVANELACFPVYGKHEAVILPQMYFKRRPTHLLQYFYKSHSHILFTFATMTSNRSLVGRSGTSLLGGQSQVILSSCECSLAWSSMFEIIVNSKYWRGHSNSMVEKSLLNQPWLHMKEKIPSQNCWRIPLYLISFFFADIPLKVALKVPREVDSQVLLWTRVKNILKGSSYSICRPISYSLFTPVTNWFH